MTFENIDFRCIKGVPIDSVETRMLGEMGFPVDVPRQPDMSQSIAFYNYVSKVSEYPFHLLSFIEKYYICYIFNPKTFEINIDKLFVSFHLIVKMQLKI